MSEQETENIKAEAEAQAEAKAKEIIKYMLETIAEETLNDEIKEWEHE